MAKTPKTKPSNDNGALVRTDTQMGAGVKTPGILERVTQGVRYVLNGKPDNGWFGPGNPIAPQAQAEPAQGGAHGRQFDFAVGYNTRRMPRDDEGVSFAQLRNLADAYDLLRIVIETRKDQMSKMTWSVGLKKAAQDEKRAVERQTKMKASQAKAKEHNDAVGAGKLPPGLDGTKPIPEIPELPQKDPRILEVENFFAFPDQINDWETWLRALIEDMLVIDAASVYPRENLAGGLYALELIDGSTIKRLLDLSGRIPDAPQPAYQQVLKGMPAVDYSRDELIYKPRNVRTNKVYGYSPVEQVIMTVNIALRRQVTQLQYYTEGNIPEMIIGVPEDWNPDQIKQMQEYWDSILEGNTAARSHAKFVPGGMDPVPTRPNQLKDEFDEWLARVVCFAFSISPTPFVKQTNRATAESAQSAALQEGLIPIMNWVRGLVNFVIWKYFGYQDLEFKWEEEDDIAPDVQAQVLCAYVAAGVMVDDEARDQLGLDPLTPEQREAIKPPPPPPGMDPNNPDGATNGSDGKAPKAGGTDKPVGKTQRASMPAKRKRVKPLSRATKRHEKAISTLTDTVASALSATLKRVLAALHNADHDATKAQTTVTVQQLLDDLTLSELEALGDDLVAELQTMAASSVEAALAQVNADITPDALKQANDFAIRYARDRGAELVTMIEDTTRDAISRDVETAMSEGWSNDELADKLSENYAFSEARAEMIARTETAYADVQGNLEGYAQSGVVDQKEWIVAQDEVCDDCLDLDGVIVGLYDQFPNDGGDGPPHHPNCRCDVLPVLAEE